MNPEDQEAMMAALEHIQDTLASVKGLRKPEDKAMTDDRGELPPEPDEGSAIEEAMDATEEPSMEVKSEPEPERFLEHGGSRNSPSKPTAIVADIAIKRGPGRPKKVR